MTLNSKNCAKTQLATVSTILCCLRDKDKKRKMQRFMTRAKNTFFWCSLCPNPCALFPNAMCFKKNKQQQKQQCFGFRKSLQMISLHLQWPASCLMCWRTSIICTTGQKYPAWSSEWTQGFVHMAFSREGHIRHRVCCHAKTRARPTVLATRWSPQSRSHK